MGRTKPATHTVDEILLECPDCSGTGKCDHCGLEGACPTCHGATVMPYAKPTLGPWKLWGGHSLYWIREPADDPESIAIALARKGDGHGRFRWVMTMYPPDGVSSHLGYVDELADAKVRADAAWAAWPEEVADV